MLKRWFISTGIMAALVGAVLVGLAMLPPKPGVTEAKLAQIKTGMTKEDVEDLFGEEGTEFEWGGVDTFSWPRSNGGTVAIWFNSGRVGHVNVRDPENTIQKIRRCLDFSPPPPTPGPPASLPPSGLPKEAFD
jgi:hypothetical protein